MIRYKAYRYRIYPSPKQAARLLQWQNSLHFLWNLAHEQRLLGLARSKGKRKYYTAFDQINQLTELRKELPWLADVPRNVSAQLLQELDKAWRSCFKKQTKTPRWKQKENAKNLGLTESHPKCWSLVDDSLKFLKLGKIRATVHRPVSGNPKTCTLRCEAGQWFASLTYEQEVEEPTPRPGPVIAIDRGITHLLADSDGRLVDNPRYYEKSMKQLARAQRAVSRKKKGSKNRDKAKTKVARLHRKTRRQRAHYLHVESARYAKSHGKVVLEALNVQGMLRNKCLSRYIADAGWSIFANMLDYKLQWSGGELTKVPPHYSSQTCSKCGAVDAASRNGIRFCCTSCSHREHADLNAAKVLKTRMNRSGQPVKGSCQWTPQRSRKVGSGQQSLTI